MVRGSMAHQQQMEEAEDAEDQQASLHAGHYTSDRPQPLEAPEFCSRRLRRFNCVFTVHGEKWTANYADTPPCDQARCRSDFHTCKENCT
jgi:hypothetical protein